MVDMALVHGLETAVGILNKRIEANNVRMKEMQEKVKGFPNDLFHFDLTRGYAEMYREAFNANNILESAKLDIEDEIDRQMSVDDDYDGEEVV